MPRYRRSVSASPGYSLSPPTREELELRFADVLLNLSRREASRGSAPLRLTLLEYELLTFLVSHPYQAFTRQQLRGEVWGKQEDDEQSNSVDVAIMSLRRKLEADGKPRLIQTLRGYGYALREET